MVKLIIPALAFGAFLIGLFILFHIKMNQLTLEGFNLTLRQKVWVFSQLLIITILTLFVFKKFDEQFEKIRTKLKETKKI